MADVPYQNWLDLLISEKKKHNIAGDRVLDLACGTGELSILLAKSGFNVTGVDLSEDMLMVARDKSLRAEVSIDLYEQNMLTLEGLGSYDFVTIFCDSLNYLATPVEVLQTFKNIYEHLNNDGL